MTGLAKVDSGLQERCTYPGESLKAGCKLDATNVQADDFVGVRCHASSPKDDRKAKGVPDDLRYASGGAVTVAVGWSALNTAQSHGSKVSAGLLSSQNVVRTPV